jgi:hypothetical protein
MPKKKYDDESSLVENWTTKKLKSTATSCHDIVYKVECFSTHDLLELEACLAELEKRGYSIKENKNLIIEKS